MNGSLTFKLSALYDDEDGDEEELLMFRNPALNPPVLRTGFRQREHRFLMLLRGDLRSSLRACLSGDGGFGVMRRWTPVIEVVLGGRTRA